MHANHQRTASFCPFKDTRLYLETLTCNLRLSHSPTIYMHTFKPPNFFVLYLIDTEPAAANFTELSPYCLWFLFQAQQLPELLFTG